MAAAVYVVLGPCEVQSKNVPCARCKFSRSTGRACVYACVCGLQPIGAFGSGGGSTNATRVHRLGISLAGTVAVPSTISLARTHTHAHIHTHIHYCTDTILVL